MPPFTVPDGLFPVEHRFTEVDGARIHYVDEGNGPLLLLLHGNPTWSFLYRKIIAGLRDGFRCVALDYPGYGMSDAPPGYRFTPAEHSAVTERFVDALGLRDMTIMVQDWGGPVGLGLACRRPELVRRLVIGNTFAWPNREPRVRAFSAVLGGPPGRALTQRANLAPRVFFWRGFARPLSPQVRDMYLAPWRDPARRLPAAIAPGHLITGAGYLPELEAALPSISDRPTLIVWGERDFAFRRAARERFEALFPDHRTVLLPGASHFLQEDAGEQIADEIRAFLSPA
jgi:haloalkane dehalogenase